jgi:hypothetical protein
METNISLEDNGIAAMPGHEDRGKRVMGSDMV